MQAVLTNRFNEVENQEAKLDTLIKMLQDADAKQKNEIELYNATKTMKLKMECEANRFMISYLFHRYIKYTGEEPYRVDYLEFMRQNDIPLKDEDLVKEIIAGY